MSATKIEWATTSWNPVTGCTPISEGCEHCYARRMANRLRGRFGYPKDDPFKVTFHPDRLTEPLRWRKPRMIFVCSMGDLFHEDVTDEQLDKIWAAMALCPDHTFILLTKRPERMRDYAQSILAGDRGICEQAYRLCDSIIGGQAVARVLQHSEDGEPPYVLPPNVWLGVTAENQKALDERWPRLGDTPAVVHWISYEPAIGPLILPPDFLALGKRAWLVCGGETGPGARPMHPDWARKVRDDCQAVGVPFFFKHWGEWSPASLHYWEPGDPDPVINGRRIQQMAGEWTYRLGHKRAGRLLDGREWNERPGTVR